MPDTTKDKHVLIIGGGFAGLQAARRLGQANVRITLIDRRNHHLFQPLLYQVATAGLSPEDIAIPLRRAVRGVRDIQVVMDEACGVDLDRKRVQLKSGDGISYDYLILAAGAVPNYFGHDSWEARAPSLKSLSAALRVREQVLRAVERAEREPDPGLRQKHLSFAVVGAGPTGVELAGALAECGRLAIADECRRISPDMITVRLIEMGERVLPHFTPQTSERSQHMLERLGVEVQLNTRITDIRPDVVRHEDGLIQATQTVWASGVKPAPLSQQLDADHDKRGGVLVNADGSLPDHPEVFVLGDMASFRPDPEGPPLPALAAVAVQQGRHAADCIRRDQRRKPREPFSYRDRGQLATIGRGRAVADLGHMHLAGASAWWLWSLVHIYQLIGVRNRANVLLDWAWQYLTPKHRAGKRILLFEPTTDTAASADDRPLPAAQGLAAPLPRPQVAHGSEQAAGAWHDRS